MLIKVLRPNDCEKIGIEFRKCSKTTSGYEQGWENNQSETWTEHWTELYYNGIFLGRIYTLKE